MAIDRSFALNIIADISDYQKKLAQVPGMTEKQATKAAERLANAMIRSQERSEKAAKKAATSAADAWEHSGQEAAKDLAERMNDVAERSGDTERALIGVADVLERVAPGSEGAVRALADLGGGLEGIIKGAGPFALALGGVGAAVAAGTAVWAALNKQLEEAEARIEASADEASAAADDYQRWRQAVTGVREEMAILLGELPAVEVEVRKARNQAAEELKPQLQRQGQVVAAQRQLVAELKRERDARIDQGRSIADVSVQLDRENAQLQTQEARLAELRAKYKDVLGVAESVVREREAQEDEARGAAAAEDELAAAQERAAKRAAEQAAALADVNAELAAIAASNEAAADSFATAEAASERVRVQLAELVDELTRGDLSPMERLALEEAAALAQVEELTQERLELARGESAAKTVIFAEEAMAKLAIEREFAEQRQQLIDEQLAEELAARRDMNQQLADMAIGLVDQLATFELDRRLGTIRDLEAALEDSEGTLTASKRAELERRLEAEKQAASRAFKFQQAAGLASVAISTAEGIQKVLAQWGLPWGLIPAALITASGAAQAAAILSQQPPTAHLGGVPFPGGTADERLARVTAGEGVVSPQGMAQLGEEGLAALNRGEGAGGTIVIEQTYRGRTLQRVLADTSRVRGGVRRAIRGERRVGHRDV